MDWYLIGRVLGAIAWPLAVAFLIYGIGWLLAASRPPPVAKKIKVGFWFASALGFIVALFVTLRELLRFAGRV